MWAVSLLLDLYIGIASWLVISWGLFFLTHRNITVIELSHLRLATRFENPNLANQKLNGIQIVTPNKAVSISCLFTRSSHLKYALSYCVTFIGFGYSYLIVKRQANLDVTITCPSLVFTLTGRSDCLYKLTALFCWEIVLSSSVEPGLGLFLFSNCTYRQYRCDKL